MNPSEKEIRGFLARYGSMGKRLTELLEQLAPQIGSIKSAGGWAIIEDDIERWKILATKVLTGNATDEEKQEVIYLTNHRLPRVTMKLSTWYKGLDMIEVEGKKKK